MLTMTETRETTKHLSVNQLREWAEICKNLRFYYKHGKWKKGTEPSSDHCRLCRKARFDHFRQSSEIGICGNCAWLMLEAKTCTYWANSDYLPFSERTLNLSWPRLRREPTFIAIRIQMLDKWVRRLSALAANRKRSTKF